MPSNFSLRKNGAVIDSSSDCFYANGDSVFQILSTVKVPKDMNTVDLIELQLTILFVNYSADYCLH